MTNEYFDGTWAQLLIHPYKDKGYVYLAGKFIAPGGSLVALKGRRAPIEVDEAEAELRRHHLRAEIHEVPSIMEDESTYVVVCTRIK